MTLTSSDLGVLIAAFEASQWQEMTLTLDGERVQLSKTGTPSAGAEEATSSSRPHGHGPVPPPLSPTGTNRLPAAVEAGAVGSPAEVAPVLAVEAAEHESEVLLESVSGVHRVTAPSVGVFWRAPEPSATPFVEIGQRVEATDPVCIVEVMKLFNHVQAGVSGTIRSIEADNGEMVEHGQTLFLVELDG